MESLEKILHRKLIPWSQNADERLIVARDTMRQRNMPDGVRLEKRSLAGQRRIISKRRSHSNIRSASAFWPDIGLNEATLLKMACVVGGAVDFQLGEYAVLSGPGNFIIVPPGVPHPDGTTNSVIDRNKSTFCEILYFYLYPNALQCWLHRHQLEKPQHSWSFNLLFQNNRLMSLFRIFVEEAISQQHNTEVLAKLFQAFALLLYENARIGAFMETITGNSPDSSNQLTPSNDFSHELLRYIETHLQEAPSLDVAARSMFLSRTQFAHRVRAETGKTYGKLVKEQRLKTAKVLLLDTNWAVKTIAKFVGYQNPHHFYIMFREETGKTPSEYRNGKQIKNKVR